MHWVDRGPEPSGLETIRVRYTPRWIEHYSNGVGSRPTDSRWGDFHHHLRQVFEGICGYCEEICEGEVDHFRPKSRFPALVYEWPNWVFACHDCNQAKWNKWPEEGYVDPCTESESLRPEAYFTFDTKTGEVIPLSDLSPERFEKAATMIHDLKLNGRHHLETRSAMLKQLELTFPIDSREETPFIRRLRRILTSRTSGLSSLARTWLMERGYEVSD